MIKSRWNRKRKQKAALALASVLTMMTVLPYVPVRKAEAAIGEKIVLTSAHGQYDGGKLYCIDRNPYHKWGVADDGDTYVRHNPYALSLPLSSRQLDYVFWGILSLKAAKGDVKANSVIRRIREAAVSQGKTPITNLVTEEDLKCIIHDASYRAKYPWLETVAADSETYLRMGGLLAGAATVGGGKIPSVLSTATSVGSACRVDPETLTLSFDVSDADFIRTVPILFSGDHGMSWSPVSADGWSYEKTENSIIFHNPNPSPPETLIKFDVQGTPYAVSGGGFSSREAVIESCLKIYECTACSGKHTANAPSTLDPWLHQRLVDIEVATAPVDYFAVLGGDAGSGPNGDISFEIFRHGEDFTSTYNVRLEKYDWETGQPLAGAQFGLYERFDDKEKVDTNKDGAETLYEGGEDYAGGYLDGTVLWDGFRQAGSVSTDADGRGSQTVEHRYHYDKTFCNGHPAPVFVSVPEEETDEETGEVVNEGEIEAAKTRNRALAASWLACFGDCKAQEEAREGVHFHWLLEKVREDEIREVASDGGSEGSTPDAGPTSGADGPRSYASSGCQADCEATYEKFISMRYSYVWEEYQAREGYVLHDVHREDLPIEIVTTDASEHGANAFFAGSYGKEEKLGGSAAVLEREGKEACGSSRRRGFSSRQVSLPKQELPPKKAVLLEPWTMEPIHQIIVEYLAEQEDEATPAEAEKRRKEDLENDAATGSEMSREERKATEAELPSVSSHRSDRVRSPILSAAFLFVDEEDETLRGEEAEEKSQQMTEKAVLSPALEEEEEREGDPGASAFLPAYEAALVSDSAGEEVMPGDNSAYSHCSGADGEGDAWRIYDHRTEGELHINKRDLDLQAKEKEKDSSYGETQGDATLEGAVYGLFAASDLVHPDGKTGVVYRANQLVAVAATDRNGNASFLANTEAPGRTYDYATGSIVDTPDHWREKAPANLYTADRSLDDYTEDGKYQRIYTDGEEENGNCWIGRPLLLGDYYVKELSRSEGYELSVGNRLHPLTNAGQNVEVKASETQQGYACISSRMYAEEQTGEGGAMPNELFFSADSRDTEKGIYTLLFHGLPAGTKFYRKETGKKEVKVTAGTGVYRAVETGRNAVAEHAFQYPKYNEDGTLLTVETPVNYVASGFLQVKELPVEDAIVSSVLQEAQEGMTKAENERVLASEFGVKDKLYVKGKLETALRRNGRQTPRRKNGEGRWEYSGLKEGIYDDVTPLQTIVLRKETAGGAPISVGSAITSLIEFYRTNGWMSFAGLHDVTETEDQFLFTVYAGVTGNPDTFMVAGSDAETDSIIYHAVRTLPENSSSRFVYVPYSNNPEADAFGTYEEYSQYRSGSSVICSAVLVTDAVLDEKGVATSKTVTENVYYQTGETPLDAAGTPIKEVRYEEITEEESRELEEVRWEELPAKKRSDGTYAVTVEGIFTDSFGEFQTNQGCLQTLDFKAVVPQKTVPLIEEEAGYLGSGYAAGNPMNGASYYLMVKQAGVRAYPGTADTSLAGEDTYIRKVSLLYPGERKVFQDAGTREIPLGVQERIIRQKVKVCKDIQTTPEQTYVHNTMAESGHKDIYTLGSGSAVRAASALPNFRFKIYLKSNLERLYRKKNGEIRWLDRNGKEISVKETKAAYPAQDPYASAPGLYTELPEPDRDPASQRLLETVRAVVEDGAGRTRTVEAYNYEKFFDAVRVANEDHWDLKKDPEREENGETSDNVRQFAITWYLKEEVEKRTEDNGYGEKQPQGGWETYPEEIYETALSRAILKAKDYLKPFFTYDLDEIYAIEWDLDPDGGKDRDKTTLSADRFYAEEGTGLETARNGYYYGVSAYLPYGTYVAVEQQPGVGSLGDFENQHYKTDLPKEIAVPSVYEAGGNQVSPEKNHPFYRYRATDTPEQLAAKYQIRMNEEWAENHTDDRRNYVISAHHEAGDFLVYKYGLDKEKRTVGAVSCGDSVPEEAWRADHVRYPYGTQKDDNNPSGFYWKDNVAAITGILTGYDGLYFQAFVPLTMEEPAESAGYQAESFLGYADVKFRNTFYTARLRIEKLDAETGENLLHDTAIFALYAAKRDTSGESEGEVLFYETDTRVTGSREFLEAMGAKEMKPVDAAAWIPSTFPWKAPYTGDYTGVIPAGTPVCSEQEPIILQDASGQETGHFRAYTTRSDGKTGGGPDAVPGRQNVGYLVTPQPLGAGVYVLCELSAPAGYTKSRPIAVEIYSDEVTYYRNGHRDSRVAAAIYEEPIRRTSDNGEEIVNPDGTKPNGNKPQDRGDVARVSVENIPIRLEVQKKKQEEKEICSELNGRLEGSITELDARFGLENLVLAYNSGGNYLGYGWPKGYLEGLEARKRAGEKLELLYEASVFTGKALLYTVPDTADDMNRYLPGAKLTLYEAIRIVPNGDGGDRGYAGIQVVRDAYGNVSRIYAKKGYAGEKTIFVKEKEAGAHPDTGFLAYAYPDEFDDTGDGIWTAKTVQREDTDLLYYDLGGLSVFETVKGMRCGYDVQGNRKQLKNGESCYALKDGKPYLEIVCPDYENLSYSGRERRFDKVPRKTELYHLDENGTRDACVDSYTGMAYVTEEASGALLAWPVKLSRDEDGNVTGREKIRTSRIASIGEDTKEEYLVGTLDGSLFKKKVSPVLNEFGLPVYYQRTEKVYKKGDAVYDRDGDYVRFRYTDLLDSFHRASWEINRTRDLLDIGKDPENPDDDRRLFRRAGENYVLENTWISGESTPNDPFDEMKMTKGQADVLKRIPKGVYILEELEAPAGYAKAMPVGVAVEEKEEMGQVGMLDRPITVSIEKTDAPECYERTVLDMQGLFSGKETRIEGSGSYTYESVKGTRLALYPARRVDCADLSKYPSGYRLEKCSETPFCYSVLSEDNTETEVTAEWTMGETPEYFEGIPAGDYLLEEVSALPGYLPASRGIEIQKKEGLQTFTLPNDHIKVEILKYERTEEGICPLSGDHPAELALFEAKRDADGMVLTDDHGVPIYEENSPITFWTTDDCRDYTEGEDSFAQQFQSLTEEYGNSFITLHWKNVVARKLEDRTAAEGEVSRQLWDLGNGSQALVTIEKNLLRDGQPGYVYDFKFNYRKEGTLVSYDTVEGRHRLDYLPMTDEKNRKGYYVLAEMKEPAGYRKADPMLLVVEETAEIQLFGMENRERALSVWKLGMETEEQPGIPLAGAELALYRAAADGSFTEEEEALVDVWISGTEAHRIAPLPDGIYYLAERTAPPGFAPMEPIRVEWNETSPEEIRAENREKPGRLVLTKVDSKDQEWGLAGALYEIQNEDTGERWQLETGENGRAESGLLKTGKVTENGWTPYRFTLRELRPPKHYVLDRTVHTFSFAETGENPLIVRRELSDEQTRITIAKTDFQTGHLVKGASLAVYRAKEKEGRYEAVGEPLDAWVSDGNSHVICGKLSAGEVYLLKEEKAPSGYGKESPVLFSLSEDGRQISSISSDCSVISFQASEEFPENIASVSVWGRKAVEIKRYLTEIENGKERELPSGSSLVLTREDGLEEGELYEWREETWFNDGSSRVTGRRFFRLHFNERGEYAPNWRMPEETVLTLLEEDGSGKDEAGKEELLHWTVENGETGYLHTIDNPEYEERNGISTISDNGRLGGAVLPGSVIRYEICAVNTAKEKKDMEVCVQTDAQTEWMPANSDPLWRQKGKTLTARLSGVLPGEEKHMILAVAVRPEAKGSLCCKTLIQGQDYTEIHPVGEAGSISLRNRVTGTAEKKVDCSFTYLLRFFGKDGQELKGRIPYAISGETEGAAGQGAVGESAVGKSTAAGKLRSGEVLCLEKNQSVTFFGLPWGTVCRAEETGDSREASERMFSSLSPSEAEEMAGSRPATLFFSYEKKEGSLRELFRRGQQYRLVETVHYSDGQTLQTGVCAFTLDGDGSVIQMDLPNEKTELWIEKTDEETGEMIAGAKLELFRNELLETWISDGAWSYRVKTTVLPGEKLLLLERTPPEGFGTAEPLEITVPEGGGTMTVSLADRPIRVYVRKLGLSADGVTVSGPVAGAQLRLETEEGKEIYRLTTGTEREEIPICFRAGERYRLVEEKAPAGYLPADPVSFVIPEKGGEVTVVMYDQEKDRKPSGGGSDVTVPNTLTEGTITVHYEEFLTGKASVRLPYRRLSPLPATGDGKEENSAAEILFLFSLILLAVMCCSRNTGERKEKGQGIG